MKLKSKLILAATGLLVLSGAATGTGIFAWFTANTSAYTKLNNATVSSHMEDLKVTVLSNSLNTMKAADTGVTDAALPLQVNAADITGLSDISLDPVHNQFVKGTVDLTNTNLGSSPTKEVNTYPIDTTGTVESPKNSIYYHEFELEFSTTNTAVSTGVFLSHLTSFTPKITTGVVNKSYRVAIYSVSKTSYWDANNKKFQTTEISGQDPVHAPDALLAYYAPARKIEVEKTDADAALYLPNDAVAGVLADKYSNLKGKNLSTTSKVTYLGSDNYVKDNTDSDFEDDLVTGTDKVYGYLGQAGSGATSDDKLDVIVRIWCEGSDPDAINTSIDNKGLNSSSSVVETANEDTIVANLKFIGVNTNGKTIA